MVAVKSLWLKCNYSLKLSLSILCTCPVFTVAPPAFLLRLPPVHSLLTHTQLLLFCCCCAYSLHFGWLVGGNQALKKETLSINIFLILSSTIRGPCLNLYQSEGKIQQKQEKLWEEIKQKLFWWKQTLPFGFCYILWYMIICMICPIFSLHIFPSIKLH